MHAVSPPKIPRTDSITMDADKEDDGEAGIDEADDEKKWSHYTGPYFLQPLLDNVQLADGDDRDSSITCLELWEGNLYIGTSQGQVLHFVLLPAEDGDDVSSPEFMLASRTQLQPATASSRESYPVGVRQILLLPRASKACILSNGVLTFYSLPELSPAYASTPVRNCNWVGGVDMYADERMGGESEVVMLSRKSRISLVRIGNDPRPVVIRNIEYPGSLVSVRRGSFACVANSTSYDLLDVDHQQKIPLFPISSVQTTPEDPAPGDASGTRSSEAAEIRASRPGSPTTQDARTGNTQGHGRSTSLGAFVAGFTQRGQSPRPRISDGLDQDQPIGSEETLQPPVQPEFGRTPGRSSSPSVNAAHDKALPPAPADVRSGAVASPEPPPARSGSLRPHVTSPTPTEFLLTTGTTKSDAGVGIFVNLDGDVCRGTIQFSRYPEDVVVDCSEPSSQGPRGRPEGDTEDFCLALIDDHPGHGARTAIEVQSLSGHVQGAGAEDYHSWLSVPGPSADSDLNVSGEGPRQPGIRQLGSPFAMTLDSLSRMLQLVRLRLPRRRPISGSSLGIESSSGPVATGTERSSEDERDDAQSTSRSREEEQFARRFSRQQCQLVLWSGNRVWWIIRNPIAVRLDAKLEAACAPRSSATGSIDRQRVADVLDHIRGQEPTSEAHFVSLGYIRQKASLILFSGLMEASSQRRPVTEEEMRLAEETLQEGMIDPRVIMGMVPFLRQDVYESERGVWVHGGVRAYLESDAAAQKGSRSSSSSSTDTGSGELSQDLLRLMRVYLSGWRRKKGFGSIGDEKQIFESVDAGLLHTLLEAEKRSMSSRTTGDSARAELHALVDQGLDCFEWAIELLERYQRLYVLSRLHQSRKMSERVLATWKRILEGESDSGGDFLDGENEMRRYLSRIRDPAVVAEYGAWLAQRNPAMGIQVFTDSNSRIRLEPLKVTEILKRRAPDALKQYLEHLVFGRNELRFANDLVMFYLDSVLSVLGSSDRARSILARSYETYRALQPPRPTYREFITANTIDETWWSDRLRLLELLGGSHGAAAAASYDVPLALARVEPFEKELVPEMIILDGKQDRHQSALRLLTHGLGDYDSAVNYCLLGGSGIFHPTFGAERPRSVPCHDEQAKLFGYLLLEFLQIEDADHRVEQTGRLLERFGRWYDEDKVLALIPETWALDLMAGYFVGALRRIQAEHSETTMVKALSGAENVQVQVRLVDRCEELGPSVETSD